MVDCSTIRHLVYPHLDGELDAAASLRVQEHLEVCSSCREIFVAERWIHSVSGPSVTPVLAPESLRRRIMSTMADEAGRARRWPPSVRLVAIAAVLGAVAVTVYLFDLLPPHHPPELVRVAVAEHDRFANNPEQLPIKGPDNVAVAEQLEQHLPFRISLPPEAVEGIQLSGSAVLSVNQSKVAFLMYRLNQTPVSLFVTTPHAIEAPGQEIVTFKNLVFHAGTWKGHHTLQWSDRHLTYVLVSKQRSAAHQACVICHDSPQGRETIAGFFQAI